MIPNKRAAYHTLGCKLNFAETSTLARDLEESGYARVGFDERADVYVINTCSVTEQANRKCRNAVGRALRRNPEAKVVVVGCYAQLKPDEITKIPGVDLVLGASEKFKLAEHLENIEKNGSATAMVERISKAKDFFPSYSMGDRTRSFLKIQDGCDYFCAFCTIPLARGKSRNATVSETLEKAREVVAQGAKEIVLTGVNIGDFGQGKGGSFFDLVKALDEIEGIERIRISSIEPNLLSDDIIEFVSKSKRFMPHFHIPLQSGSDELLHSMKRKYDQALYTSRVKKIKSSMPNACIGVDVIVGFPGENNEKFEETFEYLKELDVSYLHVFTYSERPNTAALQLEGVVPMEKRSERSKRLRILSRKKKEHFYRQFEGQEVEVLFEDSENEGMIQGYSENYLRVELPFDAKLANQSIKLKLAELNSDLVYSSLYSPSFESIH
ncbi:tRNA (N(6)-L-threonylcarbamoyladenosine(37)-C(2))-methylthiotransferase MtaB [Salibacteraceae bacterium]|nr:tRNA (N(6)-L-threonylcarbamoyladenosine(37)-C(2))-methylthiotransferase MtaB [Salibacteraceae bacterium]